MRVIAAITADFERTFSGRRSRLGDELLGDTVLRRTVKRVLAAKRLAGVHLLVDKSQEERAQQAYSSVTTYSYPVFVASPYCAYTPAHSPGREWKTEHRRGSSMRFAYAGPSLNVRWGSSFRFCR